MSREPSDPIEKLNAAFREAVAHTYEIGSAKSTADASAQVLNGLMQSKDSGTVRASILAYLAVQIPRECVVDGESSTADVVRALLDETCPRAVRTLDTPWSPASDENEEALLRTVERFGVPFHEYAIHVNAPPTDDDDIGTYDQAATLDPFDRLGALFDLAEPDGPFQTVEIPGHPGEWVLFSYPHAE